MRAVNLLPREQPRRSGGKNRPVLLGGAGGFVLVSLLLSALVFSAGSAAREQQARLDVVEAQIAAVPPAAPVEDSSAQQALATEQAARVAALSSALGGRVAWDRVLRQISLVLPEDVWLTSLSAQSPKAAEAAAAASAGGARSFTLNGATYSQAGVARFLSRLAVVPELRKVELVSSTATPVGERTIVTFSVTAEVKAAEGVS